MPLVSLTHLGRQTSNVLLMTFWSQLRYGIFNGSTRQSSTCCSTYPFIFADSDQRCCMQPRRLSLITLSSASVAFIPASKRQALILPKPSATFMLYGIWLVEAMSHSHLEDFIKRVMVYSRYEKMRNFWIICCYPASSSAAMSDATHLQNIAAGRTPTHSRFPTSPPNSSCKAIFYAAVVSS